MLVQFCFFGAYFLMSLPAGKVVSALRLQEQHRPGPRVTGLGALLFLPAAALHSYPVFLSALFVLASGITLLQVAANPYVSLLGPPAGASSRLNLSQAFNSLGTTLAPKFGGILILSAAVLTPADSPSCSGPNSSPTSCSRRTRWSCLISASPSRCSCWRSSCISSICRRCERRRAGDEATASFPRCLRHRHLFRRHRHLPVRGRRGVHRQLHDQLHLAAGHR